MTLQELGFSYLGRCACAGKPERWVHAKRLEVKKWNSGLWKLLRGGFLVRYGKDPNSIETEVQQYMTENNL
jgi:hypothetical protein